MRRDLFMNSSKGVVKDNSCLSKHLALHIHSVQYQADLVLEFGAERQ